MRPDAKTNFLNEADQILTELDESLFRFKQRFEQHLDDGGSHLEVLIQLTSALKVKAKKASFRQVTAFTHELEMFLGKLKKRKSAMSPSSMELLHRSKNHLRHMIDELKKNRNAQFDHTTLVSEMRVRTVQLKALFRRMRQIAIHTAHILEKNINVVIQGDEIEVNQNAITQVSDTVAHLIRNAIDHGIESAHVRERNGKAPAGTIRLSAHCEKNCVIIEVQDDGRGIDRLGLIERAIQIGIVKPSQTLSEDEMLRLIFQPGFSTKTDVTEVSGRGVGMDVVKNNIEALGGSIKLTTQVGKGTRVCLQLPLTFRGVDDGGNSQAA